MQTAKSTFLPSWHNKFGYTEEHMEHRLLGAYREGDVFLCLLPCFLFTNRTGCLHSDFAFLSEWMRPFGHVTGCRHCAKADRGLLRHRNKKILILLSEYAEHDSHVGWVKASTPRAGRHWFPLRHTPKPCSWGYSTKTRAPATP